jgi:hypothetical protein
MPQTFFRWRGVVAQLAGEVALFLVAVHETPSPALPARGREPERVLFACLRSILTVAASDATAGKARVSYLFLPVAGWPELCMRMEHLYTSMMASPKS